MTAAEIEAWMADKAEEIADIKAEAEVARQGASMLTGISHERDREAYRIGQDVLITGAIVATSVTYGSYAENQKRGRDAKELLNRVVGRKRWVALDNRTFLFGEEWIANAKTALAPDFEFERATYLQVQQGIEKGFTPWLAK